MLGVTLASAVGVVVGGNDRRGRLGGQDHVANVRAEPGPCADVGDLLARQPVLDALGDDQGLGDGCKPDGTALDPAEG